MTRLDRVVQIQMLTLLKKFWTTVTWEQWRKP